MRVFFDTNVILDYVLTYITDRKPFYPDAKALIDEVAAGRLVGLVSATSLTNISHVAERHLHHDLEVSKLNSRLGAKRQVKELYSVFGNSPADRASAIVPVGHAVCVEAIESNFDDYEDAVQYHSAKFALASHIVTRDLRDYSSVVAGGIEICSPKQMRSILGV